MIEGKRPSRNNHEGRVDDWLAEQGDLDWLDDPRHGEVATAERPQTALLESDYRSGDPLAPRPGGPVQGPAPIGPETIVRRRRILVLATLALVVVTAIAVAIATSGGGSSSGSPAAGASTPPTTQPGTTTTPATGQPTTPAQTQSTPPSTSLKVALPAAGKLGIGDTGPSVLGLQRVLAALKLKIGTPDGNFGPRTQAAVIAFQTAHALNPDGIVGAATAKKLNDALAAPGARG